MCCFYSGVLKQIINNGVETDDVSFISVLKLISYFMFYSDIDEACVAVIFVNFHGEVLHYSYVWISMVKVNRSYFILLIRVSD